MGGRPIMAPSYTLPLRSPRSRKGTSIVPEIINSLFGRTRNDTADPAPDFASATRTDTQTDTVDVAVADETSDTTLQAEPTETVAPAGDATVIDDVATEAESGDGEPADSDSEATDDDA